MSDEKRDHTLFIDDILMQLDKPDPEIDRIWAEEAKKRWEAYKAGKVETVSYEQVIRRCNHESC